LQHVVLSTTSLQYTASSLSAAAQVGGGVGAEEGTPTGFSVGKVLVGDGVGWFVGMCVKGDVVGRVVG